MNCTNEYCFSSSGEQNLQFASVLQLIVLVQSQHTNQAFFYQQQAHVEVAPCALDVATFGYAVSQKFKIIMGGYY